VVSLLPSGVSFSPITVGHKKLIDKVINTAKKMNFPHRIYMSQSHDPVKNPLTWKDKIKFAKQLFKNATISNDSKIKTPFNAFGELSESGIDHLVLVVGGDRVKEFQERLDQQVKKGNLKFKSVKVISAGDRDPDAEGVEGMSASKMREAARKDDFKAFASGIPGSLTIAKQIYQAVKKGMGLKEYYEFGQEIVDVMNGHSGKLIAMNEFVVVYKNVDTGGISRVPSYFIETPVYNPPTVDEEFSDFVSQRKQ